METLKAIILIVLFRLETSSQKYSFNTRIIDHKVTWKIKSQSSRSRVDTHSLLSIFLWTTACALSDLINFRQCIKFEETGGIFKSSILLHEEKSLKKEVLFNIII